MLNSATYITSYTSTDKTVVIVDTNTNVLVSFNICAIVNATVVSKDLVLHFTDGFRYVLNFSSLQDAQAALITWNLAMDTLCPNCLIANTSAPAPTSVTQITKTAYDILWNAGTVVPYTPYEVIDTLNEFGEGINNIYCFTPIKVDETFMEAKLKSDSVLYTLDFVRSMVFRKEIAAQDITLSNHSSILTDGSSTFIEVNDGSYLDIASSRGVKVLGRSSAQVTGSEHILIDEGSVVVLSTATNVVIRNVQGDLSGYALANVTLDNNSIGKLMNEVITDTATQTINAYEKGVYQTFPSMTQNMIITLDDPIALLINNGDKANSMFYFVVPDLGLGGFNVVIKDSAATTIDTLTDGEAGLTIQYKYNSITDLFEKAAVFKATSLTVNNYQVIPISSGGQTSFPSVLTASSAFPSLTSLFLNGVKQRYAVDYVITGGTTITWLDTTTILATTDLIEIYYQ